MNAHKWQHEMWLTADWVRCPQCGTVKREITEDASPCPGPIASIDDHPLLQMGEDLRPTTIKGR